jgi:hypothetical protein
MYAAQADVAFLSAAQIASYTRERLIHVDCIDADA